MNHIEELRRKAEERLKKLGIQYKYLTCDYCPYRDTCEYAYDPYNIDSDCLAMK